MLQYKRQLILQYKILMQYSWHEMKGSGHEAGGRVVCQDLIVRAGKDMACTVCVEQGKNMSAAGKPVTLPGSHQIDTGNLMEG